jgi:hypothetical protein
MSRAAAEASATFLSDALKKAETVPPEDFASLALELMIGWFDIGAKPLAMAVSTYRSAEIYERHLLPVMAAQISHWLHGVPLPSWVRKSELGAALKIRLVQRTAFWTAEALKQARAAEGLRPPRPKTEPAVPKATDEVGERGEATVERGNTDPNVFRQTADGRWEIEYRGHRKAGLPHLQGFELIRRLLEGPGRSIAAVRLMGRDAVSVDGGETPVPLSVGSPAIDARTRHEIEERLRELNKQIEIASDAGASSRASELREQANELKDYLRSSTGLGGQVRSIGSDLERSRKAAFQRYTTALRRLNRDLSVLHQHLSDSIRAGHTWVYSPSEEVRWETSTPQSRHTANHSR